MGCALHIKDTAGVIYFLQGQYSLGLERALRGERTGDGAMAHLIKHLPCKCEGQDLDPTTNHKKGKCRELGERERVAS